MRITCPNCGAQYEVALGVIPETGRDVQCSACGHTWFETGAASVAGAPEGAGPAGAVPAADPAAGEAQVAAARGAAPEIEDWELEYEPEPEEAEEEPAAWKPAAAPPPPSDAPAGPVAEEEGDAPPSGPHPEPSPQLPPEPSPEPSPGLPRHDPPPRPALAPEVAAILREEAEREKAAREAARAAAPPIETQPDLGLDAHVDPELQRAEEARRRMARLRGEAAPPTTAPVRPAADPPRARERLPDIEEINSSLRAASERAPAGVAAAGGGARQGRGFRYGFALVVILAALAALAYGQAGRIAAALPALRAPLEGYVARVDDLRLWLDLGLQSLLPAEGDGEEVPAADTPPATPVTDPPAAPAIPAGEGAVAQP